MIIHKLENLVYSPKLDIIAKDVDDLVTLPANSTGVTLFATPLMFIYVDVKGNPYKRKGFTYVPVGKEFLHVNDSAYLEEYIKNLGGIFEILKRADSVKEMFIKHSTSKSNININPLMSDGWLKRKVEEEVNSGEADLINKWSSISDVGVLKVIGYRGLYFSPEKNFISVNKDDLIDVVKNDNGAVMFPTNMPNTFIDSDGKGYIVKDGEYVYVSDMGRHNIPFNTKYERLFDLKGAREFIMEQGKRVS